MKRITECKSGLSLIIVLLCFILQSNAQGVLSLEDCRRLAIENNKKLKIADEDVKASEAQRAEAFTRYLPSIDAVGVYLRNQKEINLLSDDAHLPVGSIGSDGKFTFRPDQLMMGADGHVCPDGCGDAYGEFQRGPGGFTAGRCLRDLLYSGRLSEGCVDGERARVVVLHE